jgi:hypothetical protein
MSLLTKLVNLSANSGVQRKTPGDRFMALVEISCDNSYPTNGYLISPAVLAALLGWYNVEMVIPTCMGPNVSAAIGDFSYDQVNQKFKLFTAAGVEVANATDASAVKLYALVFGS